ncbi:HNH endonuclease signature motif containing protein [Naasia lichenicola]|nr:HNH endonuclease signature motif containing protein [Naasia lichenicola]
MDEVRTAEDIAHLDELAEDFIQTPSMSNHEVLAWLEANPEPYAGEPVEQVEVAPRRRRQQFLEGIAGYRSDIQGAQVRQIKWIAAEAATYARQAPNPIQESIQDRVFMTEVALTLGITERAALNLIERSKILTSERHLTLAAVENGLMTLGHAEVIADAGLDLFVELAERFEREAIDLALRMTPTKLKPALVKLRERLQPEDAIERHKDALLDRQVRIAPNQDGMGELWASLSGEDTVAIDAKLDACVRSIKNAGGEDGRTASQLRADVLVDLILNDDSGMRNIRPVVFLTAPAATAVGGDAPAELQGQGPIDAETARKLIELASGFYRVLISPTTGKVVDIDTTARHIPESVRRLVTLRDGTCRFPGCNRTAVGLDLDHVDDYADSGYTAADNLIALCRKHHRLRHLGGWNSILDAEGLVTWTSPSGRVDVTHPDNPVELPDQNPTPKPPPKVVDPLEAWWNPSDLSGPLPFRRGGTPPPNN